MQSEKKLRVALTLVELLVTITIMGLVIAISLPIVKPMLESNKTKSGADVVAGFLAQARNRAIEEGRPVGVTFERILDYEDRDSSGNVVYPYNGASVLMRQVAEPKPLSGFVKDVRVAVNASGGVGQIIFRRWPIGGTAWVDDTSERQYWLKLVNEGDQIQFDAKGPKYELSGSFEIDMSRLANRNLAPPVYSVNQPALFKVFRKPQATKVAPTMAPPVALPEGIVVDLDCSGMGKFIDKSEGKDWTVACDVFSAADGNDINSVTIMFSATGEVDRIYYSDPTSRNLAGEYDLGITHEIPTGPIFLNVGIWDRAGFWMKGSSGTYISNDYLPEISSELIRNYHDMNNYWVTIFPRTGAVRVNRVAYTPNRAAQDGGAIEASRRFANSMHGSDAQ